jgi:signal transduction histidine kinase
VVYVGLLLAALGLALGGVKIIAERSIEAETNSAILAEIDGLGAVYRQQGFEAIRAEVERRAGQPYRGAVYLLVDADGGRLAGNVEGWSGRVEETPAWLTFSVTPPGEREVRVRARAFTLENEAQLVVGRTLATRESFQRALNRGLVVAFVGALLIGLSGGLWLARQTERRVDSMSHAIDRVRGGALDVRLPVRSGGADEFDRLSTRINQLLTESEALIRGMRQVTDDVAHDLRTPLQRLHTHLEEALDQAEGDVRRTIEEALEDLDRLLRLFRTVLLITSTESGAPKHSFQDVNLSAVAEDASDLFEALFEEREISFTHEVPPDLRLDGNPALLAQAVANLLDNAGKFTPAGGHVHLRVGAADGSLVVEVFDTGPGIPADRREEVLRRFTRLDSARETAGHGLGLALVHAVAKLHGGALELSDNAPGLRARLRLAPHHAAE